MAGLGREARLGHLVRITSGSSRSARLLGRARAGSFGSRAMYSRLAAVTGRGLRRRVGGGGAGAAILRTGGVGSADGVVSVCARARAL